MLLMSKSVWGQPIEFKGKWHAWQRPCNYLVTELGQKLRAPYAKLELLCDTFTCPLKLLGCTVQFLSHTSPSGNRLYSVSMEHPEWSGGSASVSCCLHQASPLCLCLGTLFLPEIDPRQLTLHQSCALPLLTSDAQRALILLQSNELAHLHTEGWTEKAAIPSRSLAPAASYAFFFFFFSVRV